MAKINKQMTIQQVIDRDINAAPVFFEQGMFCIGCPSAAGESLEEACMVHGVDVNELIEKINKHLADK